MLAISTKPELDTERQTFMPREANGNSEVKLSDAAIGTKVRCSPTSIQIALISLLE